jgi:CubicO group peptidase (beta-lactamase class C family)
MRPEAHCLIGSTTKVFTATLLLQLVEEGRVALDDPVRRHLPDFRLADEEAAAALTVRHLLSHQTGLGIGSYANAGSDDGAVERYVAQLAAQPSVHAPGERWGYSNAGFIVAGRIVEALTGLPWDRALRVRVLERGGLRQSESRAEELLLRPVAKPHVLVEGRLDVAGQWGIGGRGHGPTGGTLATSAGDLARFAALHLRGGVAENGERVLSWESVAAMQARQSTVPAGWPYGDGWCLGWFCGTWSGHHMVGHAGHVAGAGSQLAVLPELDGALALVFNSVPGDATLAHELFETLARELFAVQKPPPWLPDPGALRLNLARYAGTYANDLGTLTVSVDGDRLLVRSRTETDESETMYRPITTTAFGSGELGAHAASPPEGYLTPEIFFEGEVPDGGPAFLYRSVFPYRRQRPPSERRTS